MKNCLVLIAACCLIPLVASADEIQGIVVDQDGSPVVGAEVQLGSLEGLSPDVVVYDKATSASNGHFVVNVPERWHSTNIFQPDLSISAVSGEHGLGGMKIRRDLPLPQHRIAITVQPRTKQTLQVNAGDGAPLPNCKVTFTGFLGPVFPYGQVASGTLSSVVIPDGEWQSSGTTNASGEVDLLLPPDANVGGLKVQVDQQTAVTYTLNDTSANSEAGWLHELRVPKLETVPVTVNFTSEWKDLELTISAIPLVSASGKPKVVVRTICQQAPNDKALARLPPDSYVRAGNLNSQAKGHILNNSNQILKTNKLKQIDISYGAGAQLTARVVDEQGMPAANTPVTLYFGTRAIESRTDANGRLNASVLPGQLSIVPTANSGFRYRPMMPSEAVVVPAAQKTFDAGDVVVGRLVSFAGHAKNVDGSSVAAASIYAEWFTENLPGSFKKHQRRLTADHDGRFTIRHLPAGQELFVGGYTSASATDGMLSQTASSSGPPATLTFSKAGLASVSGQVVDHAGAPVPGIPVLLRRRLQSPQANSGLPDATDIDLQLITDAQGQYGASNVLRPWGQYVAVVHAGQPQETKSDWASIDSGLVKVPLIRVAQSQNIIGQVVDEHGQPVRDARVSLLTSDSQDETRTADDGSFQLLQISGFHPAVIAEADGFLVSGVFLKDVEDASKVKIPVFRPGRRQNCSVPARDLS